MARRIHTQFPQVPLISSTQLKGLMDDPHRASSLCIVDTRTPEEVAVSIIPGSMTAEQYEAQREAQAGKTVVCYCTVGYRSSAYALKLKEKGVEAKNLEGGIVRWAQKRHSLVTPPSSADGSSSGSSPGGQETKRIHVFAKPWALQPDDYEAVMFKNPVLSGLRRVLPSWLGGKK